MSDVYIEVDGFPRPIVSLQVEWSLKQRATADVWLMDRGSLYSISSGQEVQIGNSLFNLFGGTIDEVTPEWNPGSPNRRWHLRCVSFEHVLSRRTLFQSFPQQTAGSMVSSIVSIWLTGEGITTTPEDGPEIGPLQWHGATVEQALDDIALAAGMYWDIQYSKELRFFSRTTFTAPWNINETSANVRRIGALSVVYNRQNVCNRVHVRIGQYIGEPQSESFPGDGVTKQFNVAILGGIAQAPTITLEGSPQTVGVQGVDIGKQWYWQLGSATVTQDDSEAPVAGGQSLQVDYLPLFADQYVTVEDAAAIAARAAQELSTGIYEKIIDANGPTTRWQAQELGAAYVATNRDDSVSLSFSTPESDLQIGMIINVALPFLGFGLPGTPLLIESVTLTAGVNQIDNYQVSCSSGPLLPTWQQTFAGGSLTHISMGTQAQSVESSLLEYPSR